MLKELALQNLILVESARIQFFSGFNVISGETGSGKSAILEGLKLCMGARTDSQLIRHGTDRASVEAILDISENGSVQRLLDDAGLSGDDSDLLIIRREIQSSGKTRAFVNEKTVQLSFLKQISELLIEIVGQHANHRLFQTDTHREIVDLYGKLSALLLPLQKEWKELLEFKAHLKALEEKTPYAMREIEGCQREIDEIVEAKIKDGEDEELFQEYSFLTTSEDRLKHLDAMGQLLTGEKGVLALFHKIKAHATQFTQKDPSFQQELENFQKCALEVEEFSYTVQKYLSKQEVNPKKLSALEERLSTLNRLKKKYGKTYQEILEYLKKRQEELHSLENLEEEMTNAKEQILQKENSYLSLADQLTEERKKIAKTLEKKVTEQIRELLMPNAIFTIEISSKEPSSHGKDHVEFFLSSNLGENRLPIREGASGGELARVLLALQVLLAGKRKLGTLIFDEVDASIGGKAASIIGIKLKKIGEMQQVLCITHFPQVAKSANHHIQISKSTHQGRTQSVILHLDEQGIEQELLRMAGL